MLFILGKIFKSKTRIIDIVNAVLVSQVPVIVIVLGTKLIKLDKISKQIVETSAQNKVLTLTFLILMYLMVFSFGSLISSYTVLYCFSMVLKLQRTLKKCNTLLFLLLSCLSEF